MDDLVKDRKEYLSTNFDAVDAPGHKIEAVVFEDCFFKRCNFYETEFNSCHFIECRFQDCNLSVIQVNGCRFNDVVFEDCKMPGIDWTQAEWPSIPMFSPVKFFRCTISDSTFIGLSLNEITIEACKARHVDFRHASLSAANFTLTDFDNSLFNETDVSGSDFTEAINYRIDINYNRLTGARFSRYEAVSLLEGLGIELVD